MKVRDSVFFGFVAIVGWCSASEPSRLLPWDRVVCVQSPVASDPETGKLCSAFLVEAKQRYFLVTAGHASAETNRKSRLVYRDSSGKSQWVSLALLFPESENPWHRDKTSDLAIAELKPGDEGAPYLAQLSALSIPLDSIWTKAPERTTEVVTAGFPLAIGSQEPVSAVAVVGHVASREARRKNDWGQEPVLYCTPALAQGTSGGPTFVMESSQERIAVVGMYIGVVQDQHGAKLSKMVPSRVIHAAVSARVGGE